MSVSEIAIIVAHDQNRLIGVQQQLPWHLPEDLKRFRKLTWGHVVIMGRKTFESIGRPLPGRFNIVLSRAMSENMLKCIPEQLSQHQSPDQNLIIVNSLESALHYPVTDIKIGNQLIKVDKIFIIGGQQIYQQSLSLCNKMYLTLVQADYTGDAYFPAYDLKDWRLINSESGEHKGLGYQFFDWERRAACGYTPPSTLA